LLNRPQHSNLTRSGNKFSGYLQTLRKQLSKWEDNYYHRLPNIPIHITGFRDTTITGSILLDGILLNSLFMVLQAT
ncbi:MAG: hypothetical protein ACK56I_04395, partial [bacterium]